MGGTTRRATPRSMRACAARTRNGASATPPSCARSRSETTFASRTSTNCRRTTPSCRSSSPGGNSIRLEVHRHAVDTIAQAGRRRAVRKHVAEMAAAAAAMHLGANHAEAPIHGLFDGAGLRIVEARPASAALEFLLRLEQRLLAAGAIERAGTFFE